MKLHQIFAALLAMMLVVSCTTQQPSSPEPIKIGAVFHLTGPAAFWGTGEHNAVLLAVEEINTAGGINGRPVELIVEDGKTDFVQVTTALNKLINIDKVPIIIGPTWFGQAAAPVAEESKTTILSPSTGVTVEREKYFFNLWPTERQEIIPLVAYIQQQKHKKIAIVYSQNDWSVSMKNNFVDEATKKGLIIVEEFATSPDETDFRTLISRIKQLPIDAVYAPFAFYPSQGAFSKQAKELDLAMPLYSSDGTENPELLNAFPAIEDTIYPYPVRGQKEEEFVKKYEAKYGISAAPSIAHAYDAVMLATEALRSGARTSEDFAEYLKNVKGYPGVANTITFENGRVTQKAHHIKIVKDGKFALLQ
jgi:branched-chain amino acid transport system substrate-binding protein